MEIINIASSFFYLGIEWPCLGVETVTTANTSEMNEYLEKENTTNTLTSIQSSARNKILIASRQEYEIYSYKKLHRQQIKCTKYNSDQVFSKNVEHIVAIPIE